MSDVTRVLFISSTFKGAPMIQTVKEAGCFVILLAEEELRDEPWDMRYIDEIIFTPSLAKYQDVINTVTWMARGWNIDLILPLDEFEVELVSMLREHMRIPGMGVSQTRHFRDKLTMRQLADEAGIRVPSFTRILNYNMLRDWMDMNDTPWMLKPRMDAGSMGIQKIHNADSLWRAIEDLGDKQSYYLVERFVPGDVYHVDSLTVNGKREFVSYQKYAKPPIDIYQGGGVFSTQSIKKSSPDMKALQKMNEAVLKALGIENGVTHAEFIKAHHDGEFYFLEVAARVGGAFVSDMIEMATGISLWREWGNLELAILRGEKYKLPKVKNDYAGLVLTLAKQEHPDTSGYTDEEIVWRADKPYHAGVIVSSSNYDRVESLVQEYIPRFIQDFSTSAPPMDAQRTGLTG